MKHLINHVPKTKKVLNFHAFDKAVLTWKAPEYVHHKKSWWWFLIAGIVAAAFVLYGLQSDSWTFSLAIIIFCGTYYLIHRHEPPMVTVKISKFGIKVGRHVFPYSHIDAFWIVYHAPIVKKLYLKMSSKFQPHTAVLLEDMDPVKVRNILLEHLDELKGQEEPFADSLARLFKL